MKEFGLKSVQHFQCGFSLNYRMANGERVSPETMFQYINAIQRAFCNYWKYDIAFMKGSVFACPYQGLITVIGNIFREEQTKG